MGAVIFPATISELCDVVRSAAAPVLAVGGGTKGALHRIVGVRGVGMMHLAGMLEYEPTEYIFTARAGTKLMEIQALLAEHGQYLPCDPLLVQSGGTLGGMIAASAQGPGRLRYGGVRDFVVGIQFVDGSGTLRRGGGKVVKNAAGFDFPKLFCGSLGRLGILTEVTCKVFPQGLASRTLELSCQSLEEAVAFLTLAAGQTWELDALEIVPPHHLVLRIAGAAEALDSRSATIAKQLPGLRAFGSGDVWESLREFAWVPPEATLVKVPLLAKDIVALHAALGEAPHRFSQAGNVAWIAWLGEPQGLHEILRRRQLTGLVWRGEPGYLGHRTDDAVAKLVKTALDPTGRFPDFPSFPS